MEDVSWSGADSVVCECHSDRERRIQGTERLLLCWPFFSVEIVDHPAGCGWWFPEPRSSLKCTRTRAIFTPINPYPKLVKLVNKLNKLSQAAYQPVIWSQNGRWTIAARFWSWTWQLFSLKSRLFFYMPQPASLLLVFGVQPSPSAHDSAVRLINHKTWKHSIDNLHRWSIHHT